MLLHLLPYVFDDFFYYGVLPERESGLRREIKEAG
jgi:hypothetical protein